MNKRLLILMASLFLCGAVSAQHFEADAHAHDNNMPVVAQVVLDGDAVTTGGYELGAFIGDEVRGSAQIQPTLDNTYWIQVYYSTETEENPAATVTFKLYDGDDEYTAETTLTIDPEGYGTPGTPQVIVVNRAITQTTAMVNGWNWWGTSIELNNNNGLEQLQTGLGNTCLIIKSRTDGNLEPLDLGGEILWLGELTSIHNEQMYMIQTNAAGNVTITGQRASSSSHPITINKGWNWIGYPCNQTVDINTALSGFTPDDGDQIKGRNGFADYLAVLDMWLGGFENLEPGQGYMYMSNSNDQKTLVYQSGRQESTIVNNTIAEQFYQPEVDKYAYNMTITAVIELDNNELRSDNYEVAAFVGNECRGTVKLTYVEPLDRYIAFLLVFGDNEEDLRFVLTDGMDAGWSEDHLMYSDNGVIGSLTDPAVLHFSSLGLNEGQSIVNVYPNPSKDIFNIEGNGIRKVEIINSYGQVVYSKEVEDDNLQINLGNRAIGTYLLRVITDDGIMTKQLIKE